MTRRRRLTIGALLGGIVAVAFGAAPAAAHPLGNFSVNHAHALLLTPDRIVDEAVVDIAEIPTAQAERGVDLDGDGTASPSELSSYGAAQCAQLTASVALTVDGVPAPLVVTRSSFERLPGAAGLFTTRLECRLETPVDLRAPRTVMLVDDFAADRIGWHEITAVGDGVALPSSPVPAQSTTDSLRAYPADLLSSPLDVRDVTLSVRPGAGGDTGATAPAATGGRGRSLASGGPFAALVDRVSNAFDDLVGRRDLTLGVGLVAVALAMLLGASHALLPGHGKTVMAAYIAGRQGTARDAVVVGATVTATHTGGVLTLGLALTLSSALAGETVLAWLGVASGLLIAGLGGSLLVGSARRRPSLLHGHRHGGRHGHTHGHVHLDDHATQPVRTRQMVRAASGGRKPATDHAAVTRPAAVARRAQVGSVAVLERKETVPRSTVVVSRAPRPAAPPAAPPRVSRRALVGMGVAGGLVPSPSALVVLLSAIALGRTAFGILLVLGYGLGMAATLTAAGLLLVRVRDRYQNRSAGRTARRVGSAAARWQVVMPFVTAGLVFVVGLGLAVRSLGQLG